jgi:hypothetical protein
VISLPNILIAVHLIYLALMTLQLLAAFSYTPRLQSFCDHRMLLVLHLALLTTFFFIRTSTIVGLGFVTILLDPPHGPVSDRFALEIEGNRKQSEERHDSRIHSVGFHVPKLGGGRNQTEETVAEIQSFRSWEATCVRYSRVGQTKTDDSSCRAYQRQNGSTPGRIAIEQVGLTGDTCGDYGGKSKGNVNTCKLVESIAQHLLKAK